MENLSFIVNYKTHQKCTKKVHLISDVNILLLYVRMYVYNLCDLVRQKLKSCQLFVIENCYSIIIIILLRVEIHCRNAPDFFAFSFIGRCNSTSLHKVEIVGHRPLQFVSYHH